MGFTEGQHESQHDIGVTEKGNPIKITSSSASITSDDSHASTLAGAAEFHVGSTLHIEARGIRAFRLPLPSSELEINVFHNDGSLAYTSTREKRWSGDAVLCHPKLGEMISTSYFFGPNRDPVIRLLQKQDHNDTRDEEAPSVTVSGRWTSRCVDFTTPDGRRFEWKYAKTKNADGKRVNVIALSYQPEPKSGHGIVVAQLVRGEGTRTEGTSRCTAGNGGMLMLAQDAPKYLDEALIVATCLMMLKKEIDRRRAVQMMVLAGAASGGS